jgi:hypothetical protein
MSISKQIDPKPGECAISANTPITLTWKMEGHATPGNFLLATFALKDGQLEKECFIESSKSKITMNKKGIKK